MPTYEYRCDDCGVFSVLQKLAEAPLDKCPDCGGSVYRQMSITYFKQDSMTPYKHPATGLWVDSKSALRNMDEATGTITTDRKLPPDPTRKQRERAERKAERMDELKRIVAQIDNGTAPLTDEMKARCKQENERITKATGFDAFNVAGKKDNKDGKRILGK